MAIVAYGIMWAAAGNDLMATHFGLSINDLTWLFRIGLFVFPPIAFVITRRICLALQRKDREIALHGRETGTIVRTADGEYYEVHEPLNDYDRWLLVQHETNQPLELDSQVDEHGVAKPGARAERMRARMSRFFFEQRVEPVTPAEVAAAHHHGEHEAIEAPAVQRDRTPVAGGGE